MKSVCKDTQKGAEGSKLDGKFATKTQNNYEQMQKDHSVATILQKNTNQFQRDPKWQQIEEKMATAVLFIVSLGLFLTRTVLQEGRGLL